MLHKVNFIISLVGPIIFWFTLPDTYWEKYDQISKRKTSTGFLSVLFLQICAKVLYLSKVKSLLDPLVCTKKLVIEKEIV